MKPLQVPRHIDLITEVIKPYVEKEKVKSEMKLKKSDVIKLTFTEGEEVTDSVTRKKARIITGTRRIITVRRPRS